MKMIVREVRKGELNKTARRTYGVLTECYDGEDEILGNYFNIFSILVKKDVLAAYALISSVLYENACMNILEDMGKKCKLDDRSIREFCVCLQDILESYWYDDEIFSYCCPYSLRLKECETV